MSRTEEKKAIRRRFTEEEDRKLVHLVEKHGRNKWEQVAKAFKNDLTARQCRERFKYHVDPSINKSSWTPEEEKLIRKLVRKYGKKWAKIAPHFNHRPDSAIKNHYSVMMYRDQKRSLNAQVSDDFEEIVETEEIEEMEDTEESSYEESPVSIRASNPTNSKPIVEEKSTLQQGISVEINEEAFFKPTQSLYDEFSSLLEDDFFFSE